MGSWMLTQESFQMRNFPEFCYLAKKKQPSMSGSSLKASLSVDRSLSKHHGLLELSPAQPKCLLCARVGNHVPSGDSHFPAI